MTCQEARPVNMVTDGCPPDPFTEPCTSHPVTPAAGSTATSTELRTKRAELAVATHIRKPYLCNICCDQRSLQTLTIL